MAVAVSSERPVRVSAETELRQVGHALSALRSGQGSSFSTRTRGAFLRFAWAEPRGISGGGEVAFWIFMMDMDLV
jgi:hypothetical protein